jgi:hypothetical protein
MKFNHRDTEVPQGFTEKNSAARCVNSPVSVVKLFIEFLLRRD